MTPLDDTGPTRPIFVVGCPRSGTTMLTLMLHAHSRIAMPPETRFLMPVYRNQEVFGDLTDRQNRRRLARFIARRRASKFRDLGLDRRRTIQAIVRGGPTVGTAIGTVFRAYAARFGKVRWGDKRPIYYQSVDAIREMFPDAQFIHLIRDPRDCLASLKRVPWWKRHAVDAVSMWTQAVDFGRRNRRRLPSGTFYELRYEDLVADPRTELQALCRFLGEDFEEAMLEPHRVAGQAVPERKTWHINTRAAVSADRVGGYRQFLEPWEIALIEFVAGRRMRRLGYAVPRVPAPPPPGVLLRYHVRNAKRRIGTRRRIRMDRELARRLGPMADLGPRPLVKQA